MQERETARSPFPSPQLKCGPVVLLGLALVLRAACNSMMAVDLRGLWMTGSRGPGLCAGRDKLVRVSLLLLFATGTLAGCVVGPDYQTPILALPAHWGSVTSQKASQPPQLSRWWHRLGDPTLDTLIEQAVAGNLDVATVKAKIRETRASYRETTAAFFPSLSGSASATENRGVASTGSASATRIQTYSEYQAGFDSSWELDLFGGNRRAAEAALYGIEAAGERLRSTLLTLIGDVASNYVSARGYQARIALAIRTAASQRKTASLTRTKLEAGASTAVDVANAEGEAASTEANIPGLRAALAESIHRLSVLTGQPPSSLSRLLGRAGPIPTPKLPMPVGIPADILLARPDVREAERQYAQATAKIGQAEANRYPSVSLSGNIATAATKLGDLSKNSSISWSIGPSLSVPIFEGGKLKAAVVVAQAQRDQYFVAYRSAVLAALEDVENALVSLTQQRLKYSKLAASAKSYRDAASLSRSRYESGTASFLDVLDAERSLYSAEDSAIQSRVAIATDYVALNKALGGGWDAAVDVAKPAIRDRDTGPHFVPAR